MEEFCRKWKISELSVANRAERSAGITGLYARFDPSAEWKLTDRIEMQEELQRLMGRPVRIENRHAHVIRKGGPQAMNVLYNA